MTVLVKVLWIVNMHNWINPILLKSLVVILDTKMPINTFIMEIIMKIYLKKQKSNFWSIFPIKVNFWILHNHSMLLLIRSQYSHRKSSQWVLDITIMRLVMISRILETSTKMEESKSTQNRMVSMILLICQQFLDREGKLLLGSKQKDTITQIDITQCLISNHEVILYKHKGWKNISQNRWLQWYEIQARELN